VKNYVFDYQFPQWGRSTVKFTSVIGHIVGQDFGPNYRKWNSCDPGALFEAPIISSIVDVLSPLERIHFSLSLTSLTG
jgi:DNA topoisomerase III